MADALRSGILRHIALHRTGEGADEEAAQRSMGPRASEWRSGVVVRRLMGAGETLQEGQSQWPDLPGLPRRARHRQTSYFLLQHEGRASTNCWRATHCSQRSCTMARSRMAMGARARRRPSGRAQAMGLAVVQRDPRGRRLRRRCDGGGVLGREPPTARILRYAEARGPSCSSRTTAAR